MNAASNYGSIQTTLIEHNKNKKVNKIAIAAGIFGALSTYAYYVLGSNF